VFFALYGVPHRASAEEPSTPTPGAVPEVIVTANRRAQTLEEVPYSIAALGMDEIARTGVTDIASLTSQVPGLSMYQLGTRESGATTPIIRGINLTASPLGNEGFRTFEQSPVGTYIGNSPIDGYFQLDDLERVEILRGPQGTLYGAGALGGALRVIPRDPELRKYSGSIEVGVGTVSHANAASYTASAVLNAPIGDTLAVRVSGKYAYEPGFIDVYGILQRAGSSISGIPVLANPADTVNSSGIFTGRNHWNDQKAFTGRASLLWKPTERLSADLAFVYAKANGESGPTVNPTFPGGPYPNDPRITFPPGGNYRDFSAVNQPWSRRTTLTSLDLSYDAGFATISATSSYYTANGSALYDATYDNLGLVPVFPGFIQYYAGNPLNPRYVQPFLFADTAHTFTQEIRLVSNTASDRLLDYVVGLFYEKQTNEGSWDDANPGSPEYSVAQGCTAPYSAPGDLPNCQLMSGPGDILFSQADSQRFQDKSVFGELTWHFTKKGQITFGARHFKQSFTDLQSYVDVPFGIVRPAIPESSPASKNTWKINPSYEYAPGHHLYALWSQGFRRGGTNSVPTHPPLPPELGEATSLLVYAPDTVNNYEVGVKGHFDNGLKYAFDVFDVRWDKPQVAGTTPIGNFAVWNANKAQSKGIEFDLTSPLFLPGLTLTAGGAYTNAKFTENYRIAADSGGDITGDAGQQLPGSPKFSAAATLTYERTLIPGYDLTMSLNEAYRSGMSLSTFPVFGQPVPHASGMNIVNLSTSVGHQPWRVGVYVTNLADKQVILAPPSFPNLLGNLTNRYVINQPREIAVRLSYSFRNNVSGER